MRAWRRAKGGTVEVIRESEAKVRFSELLARAACGESFVITRHGRPMARLAPEATSSREKALAAAERLKALRGSIKGVTLEELCKDIRGGELRPLAELRAERESSTQE
ncbi:MAG: type II toxin-antitoxin system prevent-host-death family antitoxin [Acidobacteriota bacterium]|nr:type II toxin-antitoxin system prevent-host-death family antitoxin [Acidobacteriota bacterium]